MVRLVIQTQGAVSLVRIQTRILVAAFLDLPPITKIQAVAFSDKIPTRIQEAVYLAQTTTKILEAVYLEIITIKIQEVGF